MARFVANFDALLEQYHAMDGSTPLRVAVVGGGAGGVEVALSLHVSRARHGHDTPEGIEERSCSKQDLTAIGGASGC